MTPALQPSDFRQFFESSPEAILVLSPDLTIVAANDAYLRATMTTRAELVGHRMFDAFPDNPEDLDADGVRNLSASLQRVKATCEPDTMAVQKYDIRRPFDAGGGFEERYWSPRNCPVLDEKGKLAYIIHRVADVTDFIRAKRHDEQQTEALDVLRRRAGQLEIELFHRAQELQQSNARLRDSNERLVRTLAMIDALFASAPIGLAFLDDRLRFVRVNRWLAERDGLAMEEHAGKGVRDVFQKTGAQVERLMTAVLDGGEAVENVAISVAPPSTPNRVRDWQLSVFPVRLPEGTIAGVAAAIVEVSDLRNAIRLRDELIAFASHDLRSPLSTLNLLLHSLLQHRGEMDEVRFTRKVQTALQQVGRMDALLNTLLDTSRIRDGRIEIRLQVADLAAIVRTVADRHAELLSQSGCELQFEAPEPVPGRWDVERLEQIFRNLLTNAAKFGKGRPIEIRVTQTRRNEGCVTIRDHGMGVPPGDGERIFARFQRGAGAGQFPGTGLGLWIVKTFVEAMGGQVSVDGGSGDGATFQVLLPRVVGERETAQFPAQRHADLH